jgi:hypothetical protein
MILFFTFLTFYSAYFNKVTDCGCFGDAIKLTPWESFTKDVILLALILILYFGRKHIKAVFSQGIRQIIALASVVICIIYGNFVLNHLPVIDFRAYKIGENIEDGMQFPDDAPKALFEYAWKFNNNGEEIVYITNGDYPDVDGDFIGVETKEIQKGYEPPIHDFTIEQQGEDFTASLMQEDNLLLVVAYDLAKSEYEAFEKVKEVTDKAIKQGYKVVGMSASNQDWTRRIIEEYQLGFEFYFTDETTLKTIVRSNPGILTLVKGTITQKVHYNDIGDIEIE